MTNTFSQKAEDYRAIASEKFENWNEKAKSGCQVAYDHIVPIINKYLLSEVCILKMMLLSLGILIGTTFSDFFKKHRKFVIVAFLFSVVLFVYKIFQMFGEWSDDADAF